MRELTPKDHDSTTTQQKVAEAVIGWKKESWTPKVRGYYQPARVDLGLGFPVLHLEKST